MSARRTISSTHVMIVSHVVGAVKFAIPTRPATSASHLWSFNKTIVSPVAVKDSSLKAADASTVPPIVLAVLPPTSASSVPTIHSCQVGFVMPIVHQELSLTDKPLFVLLAIARAEHVPIIQAHVPAVILVKDFYRPLETLQAV